MPLQIGVSYPDSTFGPNNGSESLIPIPGVPFIVLLRDILKVWCAGAVCDDGLTFSLSFNLFCRLCRILVHSAVRLYCR